MASEAESGKSSRMFWTLHLGRSTLLEYEGSEGAPTYVHTFVCVRSLPDAEVLLPFVSICKLCGSYVCLEVDMLVGWSISVT
jgi:hypothetical protein